MAIGVRLLVWCCVVLFVVLRVFGGETVPSHTQGGWAPALEFARHTLVKPKIYHGREKREIASTREEGGGHIHDLVIGYNVNDQDYVLDLQLNRELIPKSYFEKYQHSGVYVVNKPVGKDVELCHYRGQLRGVPDSWAAISTCYGVSGVIFDGQELHYLETNSSSEDINTLGDASDGSLHILFSHSDLTTNTTCGYLGTPHHSAENEFHRILRYKRETEEVIHGPYNANKQSRYVELVLVVDNKGYKERGENLQRVYHHCKQIANIVNSLYVPLNIFIALVGVVVWTEFDEIAIVSSGDTTLTNFLHYRRERLVKEHPNDNAQLLTRVVFDGGVVGKALKGPICTYEFSGGVSMDHSTVVGLVATTVAHEMGHNFGMEHDTNECNCPSERCIMAPSSSSVTPTQWSSCSLEYLALAFEHGMDYCLRNKPIRLFDSPVCGNGFVEAGEQCDCGLKVLCDNPCCNATSCMLYSNASCATGECCDLKTCHPKAAGSLCRSADHECDLPEYCTGQSEYCPDDVFKMDGESCHRGMAFCYHGSCRTHSDQCQLLWGPSGKSSDKQCYEMNTKGSRNGNCGYNRVNQSYIKCSNMDIECGMLHCIHLNERLEFGMESVAILSHSFINAGGRVIPCRTAIVDLGLNQVDPGLAPDGSKCGDGKMCVNQKCMAVGDLRNTGMCPNNCAGNGVCNSLGHCHCNTGFAPPLCDYPGTGGSEDSGPASDPEGRRAVITALYAIFLGIVPFLAIMAMLVFYMRGNVMRCWKKGSRPSKSGAMVTDSSRSPPSRQGEKKSMSHRNNRGVSMAACNGTPGSRKMEISGPLPSFAPANSDNALTSLLPKQDGNSGITPAAVPLDSSISKSSNFQSNLIGHFKGFTITSLPSSSANTTTCKLPSPPSKMANAVSPPTVPSGTMKPPRPPSILTKPHNPISRNASMVGCVVTSASSSASVDIPTVSFAPPPRPVISSPILDTTTCTAKELTNTVRPIPSRPAPQVPTNTAQKPVRPLSSPNTLSVNPITDEKKGKDSGQTYPTLTRLASFMLRQNSDGDKYKDKMKGKIGDGTNSLPRKANKLQIDREALRNLKISNPIPQQEIEVPENAVPVKIDLDNKQVVMRAQSLRDTGHTGQRPAIPTFGSMRQPSGTKRPTSIPSGTRPSSPPPPRPLLQPGSVDTGIIGLPGYQNPPTMSSPTDYGYDDCFNVLAGGSAPLANIDEESSPTNGGGNIYAVIEESPPECGRKNVLKDEVQSRCSPSLPSKNSIRNLGSKSHYASPMLGEYKSPKALDNSTSAGSIESMGLLSEIVNEIQARNFESIYSSSGDKKTKSDDDNDDGNSSVTATDLSLAGSSSPPLYGYKSGNDASSISSQGTYINAPYSSSNIYGGGSSVYSNLSMQNNPASSPPPNTKSSLSSSSSSCGYLSPTPPPSTSNTVQSIQPSSVPAKISGTLKNSHPSTSMSADSSKPAKEDKSSVPANLPQNLSSYKPYTSSFHRPLGPLAAASFKLSTSPQSNTSSSSQVSAASKDTPSSLNQSNVPLVNAEENKAQSLSPSGVHAQDKSPLHQSAHTNTPSISPKPTGTVTKAAPVIPVQGGKIGRTDMKPSNSPDVVSSCSPNTSGDASRSPDIIGGKAGVKPMPKSPDIASKPQTNAAAVGVGRSSSSVTAAVSKFGASSMASKPATVHSSFRSKQPQTPPKPNISKPSAGSDKVRAPAGPAKSKVVPGVAKSSSDVGANRTMPVGARAAASKLSHVASLQQKFETVGNGSDKTVSAAGRTVSGVSSKTKAPASAVKTGGAKK